MTDITLSPPTEPDVYSYGFDTSLNREIPVTTQNQGAVYDLFQDVTQAQSVQFGAILTGTANSVLILDPTKGFWIGNTSFSSAPFSVSMNGDLTANSVQTGNFIIQYSAGTDLIASADTERSDGSGSYTKVKEIRMGARNLGTVTVKFDLKTSNPVDPANGRIYKNGVAVGTERTNTDGVYTTFTENITFTNGDLIQLYLNKPSTTGNSTARNFRIYANIYEVTTVITD